MSGRDRSLQSLKGHAPVYGDCVTSQRPDAHELHIETGDTSDIL